MGSDWTWELRLPLAAEPALRELYDLAAERDLHPQRPDGLINIFDDSAGGLRTVQNLDVALPEGTARTSPLPNGALQVNLLEDPAAVDPLRYEDIHNQWYPAPKPT
ncbi:hypothetical protein [Actinoplanes couchii]|uniref:Uncharacterized protein n=1 Tax=Actinoplanes couchii TaxID=403638 RepID=A0ABQ3XRN5_9ACTN|nr:hypothetical protein [Actinoplanes couchii]MDR6320018.1 hypothetical protein [Actinoplanes couchii]GID61057.1 hypothetical protein Aco03nite_094610 [Actinoplanes couchii]